MQNKFEPVVKEKIVPHLRREMLEFLQACDYINKTHLNVVIEAYNTNRSISFYMEQRGKVIKGFQKLSQRLFKAFKYYFGDLSLAVAFDFIESIFNALEEAEKIQCPDKQKLIKEFSHKVYSLR